jgi:aarF domain-containing kinase
VSTHAESDEPVLNDCSALPILRQLGAQSGSSMIRGGDFSMLRVWVGLEARSFLQASVESVSRVKDDLNCRD